MTDVPLKYLNGCDEDEVATKKLPIDFSSSAQFFVATGVLCFLYTIGSEFVYVAQAQYYETNPFFPVVDLLVTGIFAIFWLAGASAWATNVSDIKHYTGPRHLIDQLANCNKTVADFTYNCFPESPGKWSTLYISLVRVFGLQQLKKYFLVCLLSKTLFSFSFLLTNRFLALPISSSGAPQCGSSTKRPCFTERRCSRSHWAPTRASTSSLEWHSKDK